MRVKYDGSITDTCFQSNPTGLLIRAKMNNGEYVRFLLTQIGKFMESNLYLGAKISIAVTVKKNSKGGKK